jgi:hypothetical protein|uniref:Uncharacterized protein n=1 Tax=viral metagenome TaxID=1070528 RepID=A0A6C0BV81_9ZZZZ
MKINLLKFNDNQWVVVPPRNTVQEILDILNKSSKEDFTNLLGGNFINDKEGQPDVLKAAEISVRYTNETEFDFELFECF